MKTIIPIVIALAVGTACGGETRQVSEVSATAAEVKVANQPQEFIEVVPWPDLGHGVERGFTIELGPDALASCRNVSPKFPYASARVLVESRPELDALAGCLNHPSMLDRTLVLVGRADPRGTTEYNDTLGLKRAESIKRILVGDGVAESRIEIATRGKAQAMFESRPDFSFGYDRRVDVVVVGVPHKPL